MSTGCRSLQGKVYYLMEHFEREIDNGVEQTERERSETEEESKRDAHGHAVKTIHVCPSWLAEFWSRHKDDADILTRGRITYCVGH